MFRADMLQTKACGRFERSHHMSIVLVSSSVAAGEVCHNMQIVAIEVARCSAMTEAGAELELK
jgi:hypothetical protein